MTAAPIIYLDHAATTPVDPRAIAPMLECLGPGGDFANASSAHAPGRAAATWALVRLSERRMVVRVRGNDAAGYQFERG